MNNIFELIINPKTGDSIVTYFVMGGVALLGIVVCIIMLFKKKNK